MLLANSENKHSQFRYSFYNEHFNNRNDAQMNLVEAICSNTQAHSVVERSLNPYLPTVLVLSIKELLTINQRKLKRVWPKLATPYLPAPWKVQFWLLGTDTTAYPRSYAFKLSERVCIRPLPLKARSQLLIALTIPRLTCWYLATVGIIQPGISLWRDGGLVGKTRNRPPSSKCESCWKTPIHPFLDTPASS